MSSSKQQTTLSQASVPSKLIGIGLISLAGAICYFSYTAYQTAKLIPSILEQVNHTNDNIPLIVEHIPPILNEVKQVRQTVENVTQETAEIRKLVPPIVDEVGAVRTAIPDILKRIDSIQTQVASIEKQLPAILTAVDDTNKTVIFTVNEAAAYRPLVPLVLDQVEKTRDQIPYYLTRLEGMVQEASHIASQAGEDAVGGFFKGIIKAPFKLISGTGKYLDDKLKVNKDVTDDDIAQMKASAKQLLRSDQLNQVEWKNPKSGNEGVLMKTGSFKDSGNTCTELYLSILLKSGKKEERTETLCLKEPDGWYIYGQNE